MPCSFLQRLALLATCALLLAGSVLGARALGTAQARPPAATRTPADGCEWEATGYAEHEAAYAPPYTLWCWDSDWNLRVAAPGGRR